MSLSDSQVRALKATDKRQKKSCGDSLFLVVEPIAKGGGKSFVGRMRFPPGRGNPVVDVRIGVYGKGVGKWSLKAARDEWTRIREWSSTNGRDPRQLKQQQKQALIDRSAGPTLEQAAEAFLQDGTKAGERTKEDYRKILWNQVLPALGGGLPVEHFAWDHKQVDGRNGRQVVIEYFEGVQKRAPVQATRSLGVLRGVFDHAIDKGWMPRDQNPALSTRGAKSKHKVKHHPTLSWEQLPQFFAELEENKANATPVMVCAVKVLFMTFLRVGSLVPLEWKELDFTEDLWVVPAGRMKNDQEHLVPLTAPLKEVLLDLRRWNGDEAFAFFSPRSRGLGHINPSSINQHLIRMGYKGVLNAHGVRAIPMTAGQEVLGFPSELIQRQLSHSIGDKVRQAYDRSEMLNERRKFMVAWCDALLAQGMKV